MKANKDGVILEMRTPYNYDTDAASLETGTECEEETRTQQQFAEEVDINTIMERFGVTGELPQNSRMPIQAEFVEAMDAQTAHNLLIQAQAAFMEQPAKVRTRFENDPLKFVDFFSEPGNRDEGERLGLVIPKPKEGDGAPNGDT
ncbi:MAG: internal scaffolding protein [Microviridae sp.]|nr:MAG: internal scaffolding protein [Microviridae sp.]